jgi:hypothetical protein
MFPLPYRVKGTVLGKRWLGGKSLRSKMVADRTLAQGERPEDASVQNRHGEASAQGKRHHSEDASVGRAAAERQI